MTWGTLKTQVLSPACDDSNAARLQSPGVCISKEGPWVMYGSPLGKAPFSVKTWGFIGAHLAGCGSVVHREKERRGIVFKG